MRQNTRPLFKKCACLILTISFISPSYAAELKKTERFKISGYYKNLFTYSRTLSSDKDYYMDTNRLRLEGIATFTDALSGHIAYDHDLDLNDFSHSQDFDIIREKNRKRRVFLDTYKALIDKKPIYWIHTLYRAYIKYAIPAFHLTVGKQAIDWSRMRLYHPFDLFNRISPLDIEKDEKVGIDAANAEFFFPRFTSANVLYVPYDHGEKAGIGLRVTTKVHDYDLAVIGASYRNDVTAGFSFDGYIKESGFRGELTVTRPDNEKYFVRATIGLDHTFTPKLYGIVEYFYNGGAARESAKFLNSYEFSRRAMSLREHIIGSGLEYDISGVMKTTHYAFYDIQKRSFLYNPELRYNARSNIDLTWGGQFFWGKEDSEFGDYHNIYYVQLKYYF